MSRNTLSAATLGFLLAGVPMGCAKSTCEQYCDQLADCMDEQVGGDWSGNEGGYESRDDVYDECVGEFDEDGDDAEELEGECQEELADLDEYGCNS